mmetsp:Transcript_8701/g.16998  ORF Transcript_8701/g.16998 Transcript_8701/m.16998 type:complete len:98 (+) Transcript_8701:49-342(+)
MNYPGARRSRKSFERANEATGNLFEILEFEASNYLMKYSKPEFSAIVRGISEVRVVNAIRNSRPQLDPTPIVDTFYQYIEDNAPEEPLHGRWKYCVL